MVLGKQRSCVSVRKAALVALCSLTVLFLVVFIIPTKELVMKVIRAAGPVRGSCLPLGKIPSPNVSVGVVSLNGENDELYQVSQHVALMHEVY